MNSIHGLWLIDLTFVKQVYHSPSEHSTSALNIFLSVRLGMAEFYPGIAPVFWVLQNPRKSEVGLKLASDVSVFNLCQSAM